MDDANLRDSAICLGILIDKIQLLRNAPTAIVRQQGELVANIEVRAAQYMGALQELVVSEEAREGQHLLAAQRTGQNDRREE